MSHKPSKAYYVEGVHRFWIDEGYVVCRIECSDYYARQAQNFCGGCKEMDFLLYHPERRDLWLVEVKDYRFDARPKVGELVCALSRKVRDTMFLLRAASVAAPDEEPAEGISLRDFPFRPRERRRCIWPFCWKWAWAASGRTAACWRMSRTCWWGPCVSGCGTGLRAHYLSPPHRPLARDLRPRGGEQAGGNPPRQKIGGNPGAEAAGAADRAGGGGLAGKEPGRCRFPCGPGGRKDAPVEAASPAAHERRKREP